MRLKMFRNMFSFFFFNFGCMGRKIVFWRTIFMFVFERNKLHEMTRVVHFLDILFVHLFKNGWFLN